MRAIPFFIGLIITIAGVIAVDYISYWGYVIAAIGLLYLIYGVFATNKLWKN
jgi:hypothetical protein